MKILKLFFLIVFFFFFLQLLYFKHLVKCHLTDSLETPVVDVFGNVVIKAAADIPVVVVRFVGCVEIVSFVAFVDVLDDVNFIRVEEAVVCLVGPAVETVIKEQ